MTLLRSPGYATDLVLLAREGGVVEEHDDHLVVRTPANPTYHWGNCLILRLLPPELGTLAYAEASGCASGPPACG